MTIAAVAGGESAGATGVLLFAEARGSRDAEKPGVGNARSGNESILRYRRCGSFVEDRYRLRERGGDHRTGASEKSEKDAGYGLAEIDKID